MKSFHHRATIAMAAGCVVGIALSARREKASRMTFTTLEYFASEMMGPPEDLLIEHSGRARYESHTNAVDGGVSAVGTYQTTLLASQIAMLDAALADPPFRNAPDHDGQIASGKRYRLIRLVSKSGVVEKVV